MAASSSASASKLMQIHAIPASDRTIVHCLKEIAKNHTDEEIYVALQESNMDPDDTIHKLMHQDTFHEVKRKRDKRKENDSAQVKAGGAFVSRTPNRVNYIPRNHLSDSTDSKQLARESGSYQVSNPVDANRDVDAPLESHGRLKSSTPSTSNSAHSGQASRNGRLFSASQAYRKSWTRVSGHGMPVNSKLNGSTAAACAETNISESTNTTTGLSEASSSNQPVADSEKDRCNQDVDTGHHEQTATSAIPSMNSNSFTICMHSPGKLSTGSGSARPHELHHHVDHLSGAKPVLRSYRNRMSHQSHQKVISIKRAPTLLEWKPKPSVPNQSHSEATSEVASAKEVEETLPAIPECTDNETTVVTLEPEDLKSDDDHIVFIPQHLQVSAADSTGLIFGTIDVNFERDFSGKVTLEDIKPVDDSVDTRLLSEHPGESNDLEASPNLETVAQIEMPPSATAETFVKSDDDVVSTVTELAPSSEISKTEPFIQRGFQLSYPQAVPNYQGFRLLPQGSQSQEASGLPTFVQPFTDPASNYFSPVFCAGPDADNLYQLPLSSNAYSGSVTMMSGQTLSSSQEASQAASASHATLAMVRPPLAIQAYAAQPAGVTISPYGANVYGYHQYMPANYAYIHAPYQSGYSGSNAYPQPPIGSSYTSSARGYPLVGAAALKYPTPQYKQHKVGINTTPQPIVATGYGGFAALNPASNAGSVSNYNEMGGQQYKDNSVFVSSHPMEGAAIWMQAPLSREVSGIQANIVYNPNNQGAGGYLHSQLTHVHNPRAGFGNYASSGATPTNHQLFQPPHTLGSAGVAAHSVIYQPQPGQLNWTNSYSVRNQ